MNILFLTFEFFSTLFCIAIVVYAMSNSMNVIEFIMIMFHAHEGSQAITTIRLIHRIFYIYINTAGIIITSYSEEK